MASASGLGSGEHWPVANGSRPFSFVIYAIIWASNLLGLVPKWALRIIRVNGLYELEGVVLE